MGGIEDLDVETQATLWLQRDATRQGISFHSYCKVLGLVGPSQARRIRRHESNNMTNLINGDGPYDASLER